jgi:hypothetical protein
MVGSVFMDDFIILRHQIPFDFYFYYFFFVLNIQYFYKNKIKGGLLPSWFSVSIAILILTTVLICSIENTFSLGVLKQVFGVIFTSIAYYTFIANNNFEVKKIFRMYVFLAFFVAAEGLMEEVLNLSGIHINGKMRLTTSGYFRIFGIMGEPYFLAVVLLPALFYVFYKTSIFERINSKLRNIVMLFCIATCFIFTFSSAGILGIGGVFFFYLINKQYLSYKSWKIILLPIFISLFGVLFNNVQHEWKEFNIKFSQTLTAFSNNSTKKEDIELLNTSSFALYSNFIIAKASFNSNPLTGSGLGTHESNYKKYFSKYFDQSFIIRYGIFNVSDANSMFVRLMSETGLLGLGLFFTFLLKNALWRKGYNDHEIRDYTLINQSIFIWFLVRLIRTGNYFGNGFFLFFFIYYFSKKIVEKKTIEKKYTNKSYSTVSVLPKSPNKLG